MPNITPCLWFNKNAKQAVDYYVSVFPDSQILTTGYYPQSEAEGLADFQKDMAGQELVIEFELSGNRFTALNAGPEYKFNQAISFMVTCNDQAEIDYYWEKLSSEPSAEQCGWCQDRFGLSWQIVPKNMNELLKKPGAFKNLMNMKKLIIDDF